MTNYRFEFFQGQSKPSNSVTAESDEEAVEKIREFLGVTPDQERGKRCLVPGSIKATKTETWDVPDPPDLVGSNQKAA